jgi:hypothetical protein
MQLLDTVGIAELLEQDERPTFIIDVANPINFHPGGPLQIVFANPALRVYDSILDMISGRADLSSPSVAVTNDFPEFKAWALSYVKDGESLDICLPSFLYGGATWTCNTLRKRLRLISANTLPATSASGSSNGALSNSSIRSDRFRASSKTATARSPLGNVSEPADYFGSAASFSSNVNISPQELISPPDDDGETPPKQAMLAKQSESPLGSYLQPRYPEGSSFDWTRLPITAALPRHIQFARSINWASTPLGPIENWGFDLRAMCNLIMGSPHPAAMYWGPEYIAIYNEAYILLAGQKHPALMVYISPLLLHSSLTSALEQKKRRRKKSLDAFDHSSHQTP